MPRVRTIYTGNWWDGTQQLVGTEFIPTMAERLSIAPDEVTAAPVDPADLKLRRTHIRAKAARFTGLLDAALRDLEARGFTPICGEEPRPHGLERSTYALPVKDPFGAEVTVHIDRNPQTRQAVSSQVVFARTAGQSGPRQDFDTATIGPNELKDRWDHPHTGAPNLATGEQLNTLRTAFSIERQVARTLQVIAAVALTLPEAPKAA